MCTNVFFTIVHDWCTFFQYKYDHWHVLSVVCSMIMYSNNFCFHQNTVSRGLLRYWWLQMHSNAQRKQVKPFVNLLLLLFSLCYIYIFINAIIESRVCFNIFFCKSLNIPADFKGPWYYKYYLISFWFFYNKNLQYICIYILIHVYINIF